MAILRCHACGFAKEISNQYIGKSTSCPDCQKTAKVWGNLKLLNMVIDKYSAIRTQYKKLKLNCEYKTLKSTKALSVLQINFNKSQKYNIHLVGKFDELNKKHSNLQKIKGHVDSKIHDLKVKNTQLKEENKALKNNMSNLKDKYTQLLTHSEQSNKPTESTGSTQIGYAFEDKDYAEVLNNFQPIIDWFQKRHIEIEPNKQASDISGYFDEIAVLLGDNLDILYELLKGIRYRQRKGYTKFTLKTKSYKKEHINVLTHFCKTAYQFTFFTRYQFTPHKNEIFINLNDSPQIRKFFAGDWLEWYSFMKVSSYLLTKEIPFSCVRSSKITFSKTGIKNELDNFFLIDGKTPLWIECKSGEFRNSINKYQALRKKLGILPKYVVLLVSGLEDETIKSINNMYDLSIVNEKGLLPYIESLHVKNSNFKDKFTKVYDFLNRKLII